MPCPKCGGVWSRQSGFRRCKKCGYVYGTQDPVIHKLTVDGKDVSLHADEWERETIIGDKPGKQDTQLNFDI